MINCRSRYVITQCHLFFMYNVDIWFVIVYLVHFARLSYHHLPHYSEFRSCLANPGLSRRKETFYDIYDINATRKSLPSFFWSHEERPYLSDCKRSTSFIVYKECDSLRRKYTTSCDVLGVVVTACFESSRTNSYLGRK